MSIPRNIILNGDVTGYLPADINDTQTSFAIYSLNPAWTSLVGLTNFTLTVRVDSEFMMVTAVTGTSPNFTLIVLRARDLPDNASGTGALHTQGTLVYHTVTGGTLSRLYKQAVNGTIQSASTFINYIPHGFIISIVDDPSEGVTNVNMQMPLNNEYGQMRTPSINGWSQLAQADSATLATVDYSYNGISLSQTAATTATHRVQALYMPSSLKKMKILFNASPGSTAKYGMMVRQSSSGKMFMWGYQYGSTALQAWEYSDSNTLTGALGTICDPKTHHNRMFLNLTPVLSGTASYGYSADNFLFQVAGSWSGYFTGDPDQVGFWIDTPSGQFSSARLVHMAF